jgi:hypothetical protein
MTKVKIPEIEKFLDEVESRRYNEALCFIKSVWEEIKDFDHTDYSSLASEKKEFEHIKYALEEEYKNDMHSRYTEYKKIYWFPFQKELVAKYGEHYDPEEIEEADRFKSVWEEVERICAECAKEYKVARKPILARGKVIKETSRKAIAAKKQWQAFAKTAPFIKLIGNLVYATTYEEAEIVAKEYSKICREELCNELYNRCESYVGTISGAHSMMIGNDGSLNGVVIGEDGRRARVETIIAGGYNIQCLHFRVLVKPLNF